MRPETILNPTATYIAELLVGAVLMLGGSIVEAQDLYLGRACFAVGAMLLLITWGVPSLTNCLDLLRVRKKPNPTSPND